MKTWLIGESNPYGSDPYYDLFPDPEGCAGWRLCHKVLQLDPEVYLDRFERRNLLRGLQWSAPMAREAANALLLQHPREDALVLLGAKVAAAFGIKDFRGNLCEPAVMQVGNGDVLHCRRVVVIPHPSGRCPLWNEPDMFHRARMAMARLSKEPTTCPECGARVLFNIDEHEGWCDLSRILHADLHCPERGAIWPAVIQTAAGRFEVTRELAQKLVP